MTTAGSTSSNWWVARWWPALRREGKNPVALWSTFILTHLWLGLLNLYADGLPLGDVTIVYKFWTDQVFIADFWVGIHSAWVYPILAIFPMLAAEAFGPAMYASTWLSMVMVLDAVGFAAIIGWGRTSRNSAAAWWWIGFLLLLGPIAMGRIDSITVPLAIVGVMFAATRPRVAALILTIAAWIKVWPAALVGALIIATQGRWRILVTAVSTSILIIVAALSFGSGPNVFSFVTQQTDRGLQIEAPISTIWLWQAFAGAPGTSVYYDQRFLTWQVTGDGVGVVIGLMTPMMALVVVAVVLVAVIVLRRGASATRLLPPLALALVTTLIAFNKVGSPQFIGWLAVPVILGLVSARSDGGGSGGAGSGGAGSGGGRSFVIPAVLVAIIAALTQACYPYLYGWLLGLHPILLVLLTARNLALFVLLGWAIIALWNTSPAGEPAGESAGESAGEHGGADVQPAPWPLESPPQRPTERAGSTLG